MKLYGRISTRKADEVFEGRAILFVLLVGGLVIFSAVESLFGKTGVSVLSFVMTGLFYLVAVFILIKAIKFVWQLLKAMAANI